MPSPERVAQNDDQVTRFIFRREERPAQRGLRIKQVKKVGRNIFSIDAQGLSNASEGVLVILICSDLGKRMIASANVSEVGIGNTSVGNCWGVSRVELTNRNQLLRIAEWERTQQNAIHDAEDRRISPNRQGERQ